MAFSIAYKLKSAQWPTKNYDKKKTSPFTLFEFLHIFYKVLV